MTFTFRKPASSGGRLLPRQDGNVNAFDLVQAWPSGGKTGGGGGKVERRENRSARLDTPSKLCDMFPRLWKHESF